MTDQRSPAADGNGTFTGSGCSVGMKPAAVLRFPSERISPSVAIGGATWWGTLRERLRTMVGDLLNRAGAPGAIRAFELTDDVTRQRIAIQVGARFVRLSVDGRDYYFDRLTGRFDGTGSSNSSGS